MAALSKAFIVFDRSNTGIVGSNPARGVYVCMYVRTYLRVFCVVLSCVGTGIATGRSPVQGVLPKCPKIY
jgi:hypothetical protein